MREKILLCLFFSAVFVNFLGPVVDPDFPFHLETGEYIYTNKEIPKDDPFSFYGQGVLTERERFTLSQYWIAQLIFFKLYSLFGLSGIILLRAIVFSTFVFLLWFILRKRGFYSSLMIVCLVTILLQMSKLDRPQFFSFLFTLILIMLFERFRERPQSPAPLFFIPPLILIWANIHAGFVFGIIILLIYAFSEVFKLFINKPALGNPLEKKPVLILLTTIFLSILVSYINPDMNGQFFETWNSHTNASWLYKDNREYISPIKALSVHYGNRISSFSFFFIFGFVSTMTILQFIRKKTIDITVFSLIIFSSIAAFTAVRYMPFFIAISLPLTKDYRLFENTDGLKTVKGSIVAWTLLLTFFIFAIVYGLRDYNRIFTIDNSQYPEGAANFLLSNRIEANMFNQHNKGSYLIWRLYPYYKVFNDTRFISLEAVYDTDVISYTLDDYEQPPNLGLANALSRLVPKELGSIQIFSGEHKNNAKKSVPLWKKLLKQYNINLIVHEACTTFTKELFPLILRLVQDDEWSLIYLDGTIMIFVKNTKKYTHVIEKFKLPKKLIYDEILFEAIPLVRKRVAISTPYSSLAFVYMMKGKYQNAENMIEAALSLNPNDFVAHFCKAYLALTESHANLEYNKLLNNRNFLSTGITK